MTLRTKRWNDPLEPDDGYRVLVCRYRPRGVPRRGEPWDAWVPELGPSVELHAAVYGKHAPPISWEHYAERYRVEMERPRFWLRGLAERLAKGDALTLLCSSACTNEARCHRTILKSLLETYAAPPAGPTGVGLASDASGRARVVRRAKR